MLIMITGITRIEEALKACNLGANALGFLAEPVYGSESISPEVAASITKSLSPACESVLVTHLVDVQEIIRLASIIGATTIQLPGNTMPADVIDIKNRLPNIKVIKSIHVLDNSCMEQVEKYVEIVDAIELDTIDMNTCKIGGTGKTHDWNISKKIVQEYQYKVPIILAGGLRSDNIENAIRTVKPSGVDVSSGVKDREGALDDEKLASFIYKAKHVNCGSRSSWPFHSRQLASLAL